MPGSCGRASSRSTISVERAPPSRARAPEQRKEEPVMLSYAHGACEMPLLGETIAHNLERTVARVPDSDALVSCHQGARYTYAEFNSAAEGLAGSLLAAGLQKGDRGGVWSPNRFEWT